VGWAFLGLLSCSGGAKQGNGTGCGAAGTHSRPDADGACVCEDGYHWRDPGDDADMTCLKDEEGDAVVSADAEVVDNMQPSDAAQEEQAGPEVIEPADCITQAVCAAASDCQQGERCNLTLSPPKCQKLYCAGDSQSCDPAQGDVLCQQGFRCLDGAMPYCCEPRCDGHVCGPDPHCGVASCGDCATGVHCQEGECIDNRTWYDETSGLTWQTTPLNVPVKLGNATTYCSQNTDGLPGSGWRLPTLDEARSLVRGCPAVQPGGACKWDDACCSAGTCDPSNFADVCAAGCALDGGPGTGGVYLPEGVGLALNEWTATADASSGKVVTVAFHWARLRMIPATGDTGVRCVRTGK
jgi:hypothetical protein